MDRYQRQILLPQFAHAGQTRLAGARALLVGCGALGSVLADQLVRAGVGTLRLVDRDIVEPTNLQRQVLYDEQDARAGTPKAVAAADRLRRINSLVRIEPIVCDVHAANIEGLAGLGPDRGDSSDGPANGWVDLILDGTDNAETRYLLNDVAVKHGVPWVYGACVGTEGRMMPVRPPGGACLRCVFPEPPGPGELPTCDTVGVLGPVAAVVAALQAVVALKLLTGQGDAVADELIAFDLWTGRFRQTPLSGAKRDDCKTCGRREFEFLDRGPDRSVSLCGRNAVQVRPGSGRKPLDLQLLAVRLSLGGPVERTPHLVRCRLDEAAGLGLTVFADGRAIINGTSDPDRARSLYARWVGT